MRPRFPFGIRLDRLFATSARPRARKRCRLDFLGRVEPLEDRALLSTTTVHVADFQFTSSDITIHVGDTVHWVWDNGMHSTTSVAGIAEAWDSGLRMSGFTYDHTFTHLGTFSYYCSAHGRDNGNGTASGMSGTVTVTGTTLQSIAVAPANPSIAKGDQEQFTATGTYSDNSTLDLSDQVTWASATPGVASITASGLATGLGAGTSTISATTNGVSGSTTLTVTPATLSSIAITPANPIVHKGDTQQFTATARYSDSTTQNLTNQVTWASSAPGIASISATGLASTLLVGSSTISASFGGVSSNTLLTVTSAALRSIAVLPDSPSVPKGQTVQFAAMGTFSDNSTRDVTSQVTWASAAPGVASITASGQAKGLALGTSTIGATMSGISGSTTLLVTPAALVSLAVTPADPVIGVGLTRQFVATGTYSDGTTQNKTGQVTWDSDTPSVATVTATGLVSAVSIGDAMITATLGGVSASTMLSAINISLDMIAITPGNPRVSKGGTLQFSAMGMYSDNSTQDLTGQVDWESASPDVATISATGRASTLATGTSVVSASLGDVTGSTTLTVTPPALLSIGVAPALSSLARGRTLQYTAVGSYSDQSTQDLSGLVRWDSSNPNVATISASGSAAGLNLGSAAITATFDGVTGSAAVTVAPAALTSIAIGAIGPDFSVGQTRQLTARGTYSDQTVQDLSDRVAWASLSPSIAAVTASGLATALAAGPATISASFGGLAGSATLTVAPASLVSIALTPAGANLATGASQRFSAIGLFSDQSTRDLTGQVAWTTTNPAVATVSPTGLATATGGGAAAIRATFGGLAASATVTVPVVPPNPRFTARGLSAKARLRKPFKGNVATFKDPRTKPSDFVATIRWGDQLPDSAGRVTRQGDGKFAVSASHPYGQAGTFHVTVTIRDPQGRTVTAGSVIKVTK